MHSTPLQKRIELLQEVKQLLSSVSSDTLSLAIQEHNKLQGKFENATFQQFLADSYEDTNVLKYLLNLSSARYSQLKKSGTPSLETARLVFTNYQIIIYPYSLLAVSNQHIGENNG